MKPLADRISNVLAWVAGVLFVALFLVIVLNITLRNLGGITWLWIPGMTKFLFIWTVFIAAAVLYHREDHLVMDFFFNQMGPRARRSVSILLNLLFLAFLVSLIIYGFQIVRVRMGIPFETWDFPTGYAFAAAPVSAIIMVYFCYGKLKQLLRGVQ